MSTLRPQVCTDTMEAERLGVTETVGKVVRKGGSLYPGKKKREMERKTFGGRQRERESSGGKGDSQCGQPVPKARGENSV